MKKDVFLDEHVIFAMDRPAIEKASCWVQTPQFRIRFAMAGRQLFIGSFEMAG
jgi:hypothetical protein